MERGYTVRHLNQHQICLNVLNNIYQQHMKTQKCVVDVLGSVWNSSADALNRATVAHCEGSGKLKVTKVFHNKLQRSTWEQYKQ